MSNSDFNIQHGQFIDVQGRPQRHEDLTFVPAEIVLNGTSFRSVYPLEDFVDRLPATTRAIVHPGEDAPWVLGRLMRLFDIRLIPEEERGEKSCFFASFLAVHHNRDNLAVPFECSDYYGASALTFSSDNPPDDVVQQIIARHFWQLLLADPSDVADYEDRMYHLGASMWIRFGIENGEPFMIDDEE